MEPELEVSPSGGLGLASGHPGPALQSEGGEFLKDPWEARDEYIEVILDRSPENRERFLGKHQRRELGEKLSCCPGGREENGEKA